MPSVEVASAIESVSLRTMWTILAMVYFGFATALVMSRHRYPLWTWSTFYIVSVGILIFFNINYYVVSPILLKLAEILLWSAGAISGAVFFAVLLLIGDDIDAGLIDLPQLRELPRFIWRWATGTEAEMDVGFAVCVECGHICRADIYEDGSVRPVGVADCPGCGHGEWRELIDVREGWVDERAGAGEE